MSFATLTDKRLTCRDCKQEFVFSVAEQEQFLQQGYTNDPSRCLNCRTARKERQAANGQGQGQGPGGINGRVYDNNGFMREPRARREMHQVTCSSCNQPAQVPFIPRGDRPVYCSNCFDKVRSYR